MTYEELMNSPLAIFTTLRGKDVCLTEEGRFMDARRIAREKRREVRAYWADGVYVHVATVAADGSYKFIPEQHMLPRADSAK